MKILKLAALVALLSCELATAAGAAAPADGSRGLTFLVEPAPGWIAPVKEAEGMRLEPSPMHYRVLDDQLRVGDKEAVEYHHFVRVVDTTAGLQQAAQIELEFDPSYQVFVWHHLDVVRDGKRLNRLDRKRIQVLQRETQLERRVVDGRATVAVTLDDVRVGDEVDYAFSIRGRNPVFNGRYVDIDYFGGFRGPVATHQIRLLAPANRDLRIANLAGAQATTRQFDGMRETVLRATGLPQIRPEAGAPESVILKSMVSFSEFADWQAVAAWGRQLFTESGASPLVDAKAAQIRASARDKQARALAALDLVQREVRYFGTEMGASSHRPQAPELVLQQRFGDCKDKVGLLVALLRRLDIEAVPVLVSTGIRNDVAKLEPTPLAFDHVIARVDVDGATYWLDATRARQTGPLAARSVYGYGKGLPLEQGANALVALPEPFGQTRMAVDDAFSFSKIAADARLESRITYRGDLAELIRMAADEKGLADLATDISSPYRRLYPALKVAAPAELQAVADDDAVVLVQHFAIPDLWRYPQERSLVADIGHWSLAQALQAPKSDSRRDPLAYARPGIYKHSVTMDFAEDVLSRPVPPRHEEEGDGHFRWLSDVKQQPRHVEMREELRLLVEEVAPQDWRSYTAKLAKLIPQLGSTIGISAIPPDRMAVLSERMKDSRAFFADQRPKPTTQVQMRAAVRRAMLTEALQGGRLSPPLEAQALVARGIEYDNLGLGQAAQADFRRALVLTPGAPEALQGAAMNAIQLNDFAQADALASQILAQDSRNMEALRTRAVAKYMQGDFAGAQGLLQVLLAGGADAGRGYPLLWSMLTALRRGETPAKIEAATPRDRWPTAWPRPILDHLTGHASADDVLRAARATEDPAGSQGEAYFYLGELLAINGDGQGAARYWQKSVDLHIVEFIETGLAAWRVSQSKGQGTP